MGTMYKEPQTHLLISVGDKNGTLPIGVSASVVRRNIIENPNDKTRPGEQKTLVPEKNTGQLLTSEKMIIAAGK